MNLTSLLAIKWKIGAFAGLAGIAVASFFLLLAQMENRHLTKVNANLDAQIHDPNTGYIVTLDREKLKVVTLNAAIDEQNQRFRAQAAESERRLAETTATLTKVQHDNTALRAQADRILSTKPSGKTLEERVRDIDARVLETLE